MRITVKYIPPLHRSGLLEETRDYPTETSVGDILADLELPPTLHGMTLLNGRYAENESPVHDGDVLTLLPLVDGG